MNKKTTMNTYEKRNTKRYGMLLRGGKFQKKIATPTLILALVCAQSLLAAAPLTLHFNIHILLRAKFAVLCLHSLVEFIIILVFTYLRLTTTYYFTNMFG